MEDIKYRAYRFAVITIKFLNKKNENRINHPLVRQVIRSSSSIGANIVEGRAGSSRKEMIRYYNIALKSTNETKYWLCLLRDTTENDHSEYKKLLGEADEISRILAKSIIRLKEKVK